MDKLTVMNIQRGFLGILAFKVNLIALDKKGISKVSPMSTKDNISNDSGWLTGLSRLAMRGK